MQKNDITIFRIIFIASALWNLLGAIFGYFNTAYTFNGLFNRDLNDPLFYAIYKGAWGTTFTYFFGYLIVAFNPLKHTGIVVLGAIGKVGFAISLLNLYLSELADSIVFIIIVGDFIFFFLFLYYLYRLYKAKEKIL
ncbi:MAG: hypothetical protein OEZ34_12650 [Spirochaetia bacterium]|nr:hypothetical protein [Spirochaetia bacterium]